MKKEISTIKYVCPKCGGKEYNLSEIRVHFSFFSQFTEFGNRRLSIVTCSRCFYTELYKIPLRKISDAFVFQQGK